MSENYSTGTARIRALKDSLVTLLEKERESGVPFAKAYEGAALLIEAFQEPLNTGSKQLVTGSVESFGKNLRAIEERYADWRAVDGAFAETIRLAYAGGHPRTNLMLDTVHAELTSQIGEPISALYARLHADWSEHLGSHPWDEYFATGVIDADWENLHWNLQSLVHGDHLDVEDAVENLTGPLRYAFANYLEESSEHVDMLEESLWMRPEIVVMNDYWRQKPQVRILDVLRRRASPKFAGSFARVQDFLSSGGGGETPPETLLKQINAVPIEDKETYLRCLTLHPDQAVRRFAVSSVDVEGLWKVVTPDSVPCATILSMLERIARSQTHDQDVQKVFFQAANRRLLSLTTRADVMYARGITRIFATLPFFMEDEYFESLMVLIDYVAAKEKYHKIEGGVLDDYIDRLRREKDKIGTLKGQTANLTSIPPVVLRKLARDGHFWFHLAMHPMFKIARETIPHINSQERAVRIANNHRVNQDVLRDVGKRRALFGTLPAKMALLNNPRTPPAVSVNYLSDLMKADVEKLLRSGTVHPEVKPHLRNRLQNAAR